MNENFFLFCFMRLDYVINKDYFEYFVIYKFYVIINYIRIKFNYKFFDYFVDYFLLMFNDMLWLK